MIIAMIRTHAQRAQLYHWMHVAKKIVAKVSIRTFSFDYEMEALT